MSEHPSPGGAATVIDLIADAGSFEPWDGDVVSGDPLTFVDTRPYPDRLADATRKAGTTESVITGYARVADRPLAVIAMEFGFLGGSIGIAAGERLARAFERAKSRRLPLLAVVASGGTRMQEGTLAFLQMIKVSDAVRRFRQAGLLYVTHLANPTTGGVLASWGSLGALTFAQPDAFLGFSGPRVTELLTGRTLPEGIQRSENLLAHGLIDDVLSLDELRLRISKLLSIVDGRVITATAADARRHPDGRVAAPGDAWESVRLSRDPARAGGLELMAACVADFVPIGSARMPVEETRCIAGMARVDGVPAVLVAQNRHAPDGARMNPADLRRARRAFELADELRLPLVTVIDTVGASLSVEAEEGGLAREIARCIMAMLSVRSPTLTVLLGEGAGGAAIALFPADRVVAAQNAWLSAIAPEGASAILYRDNDHAAALADAQRIAATRLAEVGIVDTVVPEEGSGGEWVDRVGRAMGSELRALAAERHTDRLDSRTRRYRFVGNVAAGLREESG